MDLIMVAEMKSRRKESKLGIPAFQSTVPLEGQITASPDKPLQFATISNLSLQPGKSAGFKDPLRFYCLCKGAANAINS